MTTTTRLTRVEQAQICALYATNQSCSTIARQLNRNPSTITRFLVREKHKNLQQKRQRNQKLSRRAQRQIVSAALRDKLSAREICESLGLDISVRRVQQILSGSAYLRYSKAERAPHLSKNHRMERVKWAEQNLGWDHPNWRQVIFSDEKKFNLDGPDGLSSYWRDLRKEPEIFSTRQQGGGSVMIWGAISYHGTMSMVGVEGNMDSKYYCEVLEQALLPDATQRYGDIWTFVQDNASIHSSNYSKSWLEANDVHVLQWPAKSPDLNIIENVWGTMARKVYAHGRQYSNVGELSDAIQIAWDNMPNAYIKTLYTSIPRRLISVIRKNGKNTDY